MGNVACSPGHIACEEQTDERTETFRHGGNTRNLLRLESGSRSNNMSTSEFLSVHVKDRPEKCIIDHQDVVDALVQQSMELIRRGNNDASLFSSSSDGSALDPDDDGHDEVVSMPLSSVVPGNRATSFASIAPSEATMGGRSSVFSSSDRAFSVATAVTTDTKETRVIRNRYRPGRSGSISQSTSQGHGLASKAPRVISKGFHAKAQMQSDLHRAIAKTYKKQSDAQRLSRIVNAIEGGQGCALIPAALTHDPVPSYLGEYAREHMTILHLRIKPRFTDYFQSHLSRLLPDNPFTQALSQGIALNRLSRPRRRHGQHPPPTLTRTYSDSSESSVLDPVEFGEGPPSHPVHLLATGTSFLDLGITGSLGLADRRHRKQSCTAQIKPPSHYIVLLNRRSGVPLAVCALKTATTGPPVVRIYVTKRRLYGQRPAATTKKLGLDWSESYPLYPWAEIVTEGRYPNRVQYSIYLAKGNDGRFEEEPSYRAEHASVGSPEIRVMGRTEREFQHTGCAVLSLCREEGQVEENDLFLSLSISKGIDPALFVCFAAFVDEAMEKTMRQQCQALSESIYRRS